MMQTVEERPRSLDSDTNKVVEIHQPDIHAIGRHRSSDIWIAAATEEGRNWLINTVDQWLSRLSDQLSYTHRSYPVLVHGLPNTFNMSSDRENLKVLIGMNTDSIEHPSAVQCIKPLPGKQSSAPGREARAMIIHFANPTMANHCIDRHIALWGRLLPAVKFIQHPPHCYNCHCEGHLAHSCKQDPSCGLCVEGHNTRECGSSWKGHPSYQAVLLKCARCEGPYAAADRSCPAHRADADKHRHIGHDTSPPADHLYLYPQVFLTFRPLTWICAGLSAR